MVAVALKVFVMAVVNIPHPPRGGKGNVTKKPFAKYRNEVYASLMFATHQPQLLTEPDKG